MALAERPEDNPCSANVFAYFRAR